MTVAIHKKTLYGEITRRVFHKQNLEMDLTLPEASSPGLSSKLVLNYACAKTNHNIKGLMGQAK